MHTDMPFSPRTLLAVAASFCLALVLTPLVRTFARRFGFVAVPKTDRWHKKPTAMLGGVAIWLSVVITMLDLLAPIRLTAREILLASTFLFLVGLVDDLIHIKPYQKLIGQILGAAFVVYYGLILPWTGSVLLNMALAIFWLIGITNAINLLDNMDGLASGIAIIAAGFSGAQLRQHRSVYRGLDPADLRRRACLVFSFTTPIRRRSSWATAVRCLSGSFWRVRR